MVTVRRKQRDAVFRAIADPTRREILGLLRGGRQTVGEIAGHFPTSRPAISKHLRLLRSVGLVVTGQEGATRICALNAKPPFQSRRAILSAEEFCARSNVPSDYYNLSGSPG